MSGQHRATEHGVTGGELRDQLVAALRGAVYPVDIPRAVDDALPVVRAYAAEELRMAADALERQVEQPDEPWGAGVMAAVELLYDRVEALGGRP